MSSDIIVLSPSCFSHYFELFGMIQNWLRNLPMLRNSPNLGMILELLHQFIFIICNISLLVLYDCQSFSRPRFPKSEIHFTRSRNDVSVVQRPLHTMKSLHSFWMVNVSTSSLVAFINSHSFVKTSRNKFKTCWTVIYIHNSHYMVFMKVHDLVCPPQIKCVKIIIVVGDGENIGLHGVPRQGVTAQLHSDLFDRVIFADVV